MKIILLITFLITSILAFGQVYKIVETETLNVRNGAGKEWDEIGEVYQADKLQILHESDGWSKIKTESGLEGFVSSEYLSEEIVQEPEEKEKPKSKSWTNILINLGVIAVIIYFASGFIKSFFGKQNQTKSNYSLNQTKKKIHYHISIKNGVVYLGKEKSTMQKPIFKGFEKAIDCDLENPTAERSKYLVTTNKGEILLCELKHTGHKRVFKPFSTYGSAYKARFSDNNSFTFQTEKGLFKGYFKSTKIDKLA